MPKVLFDADGNEVSVPNDEELKTLNEKAAKADELENSTEQVNWKAAREKENRLKAALKAQGKDVDDEGNVIDTNPLSKEQVEKTVVEQTKATIFQGELDKVRSQFPDKDKEVFDYYFNKFMAGEEKNVANLMKFAEEAKRNVYPPTSTSRLDRAMNAPLGGVPNSNNNETSDTAKEIARDLGIDPKDLEGVSPVIKF